MPAAARRLRLARTRFLGTAAALALAGCASFTPQAGPGPEPGGNYVTLTTPIIAVGDTQEHLPTGYPLLDNDSAVDAYVEVTQRPPEQPLFGRRILEWALLGIRTSLSSTWATCWTFPAASRRTGFATRSATCAARVRSCPAITTA